MTFKPAILLTLLAAASFTAATAVAQDSMSNTTPQTNNSMSASGQYQEITDLGMIENSKSASDWVGKSVTLRNAAVQDTNNDGNFWVGRDGGHRILIVKPENNPTASAIRVHKGDVVTVSGVVQPASKYQATVSSASKGSMHDAEKTSGVFVMADNIQVDSTNSK